MADAAGGFFLTESVAASLSSITENASNKTAPVPTTITIGNREIHLTDVSHQAKSIARELAANLRLLETHPLPSGEDLSEQEDDALQANCKALALIPQETRQIVFNAFSAHYLLALANALRSVDPTAQPIATRNMIRVMASLHPRHDLYYRRFLRTDKCMAGVPTVIASAVISGIASQTQAARARACFLLIHILEECDPSLGDGAHSCVNAAQRIALGALLHPIVHENSEGDFAELKNTSKFQHAALSGLDLHLKRVEFFADPESPMGAGEPGAYFRSLRGLGEAIGCAICDVEEAAEGEEIDEDPEYSGLVPFGTMQQCSRCRSVKCCGHRCQMEHWRKGHKLRCFKPTF